MRTYEQQIMALQSQIQQLTLRSQQQQVASMMQSNINMQIPNMLSGMHQPAEQQGIHRYMLQHFNLKQVIAKVKWMNFQVP